jgi:hypothetical protein
METIGGKEKPKRSSLDPSHSVMFLIERFKSSAGSLLGGKLASESSKRFVEEFTKLGEHGNGNSNRETECGCPREKTNFDMGSTANEPQKARADLEGPKKAQHCIRYLHITFLQSLLVRPGGDLDLGQEGGSTSGGGAGARSPDEAGGNREIRETKQEDDESGWKKSGRQDNCRSHGNGSRKGFRARQARRNGIASG